MPVIIASIVPKKNGDQVAAIFLVSHM